MIKLREDIPRDFIENLRERSDIVDVISSRLQLRKAGREYVACCPFHNEKSPSFSVSPEKQFYHCFGCGRHGDVIQFLMDLTGADFLETVEDLASSCGMAMPVAAPPTAQQQAVEHKERDLKGVLAAAARVFRQNLRSNRHAVDYMKGRGLTGEIAKQFALGYASDGIAGCLPEIGTQVLTEAGLLVVLEETGEVRDKFRHRLMFPIHDERGDVVGFGGRVLDDGAKPKYLNSPETPIFHKGSELYGLFFAKQEIRRSRSAVVLEGYMDVIALHQHGETRAVAALGTSLTEDQLQKLFRFGDEVIFCFDGDKPGSAASDRAMKVALAVITDGKAVKFMALPSEHDPDSYIREHGIDGWHEALHEMSVPLSLKMVHVLSRGLDLSLPESKVTFTREAGKLLALMVRAPALREAIRKHIEDLAGLPVTLKLDPRQLAAKHEEYAPLATDVGAPDPKCKAFYANFALLCGLQHEFSADVPASAIDDFAVMISIWFSVNQGSREQRLQALQQVTLAPLRALIGQALERIRERFDLLPQAALDKEAQAIVDVIERDLRRKAATQHGVLMFSPG